MQFPYVRGTLVERLWSGIDKRGPEECWPWLRSKSGPGGYGAIARQTATGLRQDRVHRVVYELTHGYIPAGHYVCHTCDHPWCCNPAHLFAGTARDNVQDCVRKGRRSKHRTPYNTGAYNNHAKLTERQMLMIRRRVAVGASQTALAKQFGLNKSTIWRLVHGLTWKHLDHST